MAQPLMKAQLISLPDNASMAVHFNPSSLVYTVENKAQQTSGRPRKQQFVAQFSGKLTMDLQFDTTDTGDDVRTVTNKVARFMQPLANATHAADEANMKNPTQPAYAPPVLMFKWGSYEFKGIMESFKETIDLFSSEGVALRALVSIGLARQDQVLDEGTDFSPAATSGSLIPTAAGDSVQSAATKGGDPRAARQLASDNGLESMRFTGGAALQVNASAQLNPPAGFVSASANPSAGLGVSAGIGGGGVTGGIGVAAGASMSAGGSAGVQPSTGSGAGISAGAGAAFGGKASAGVSATAGAFSGLQTGRATVSTTAQLNPLKMMSATVGSDVSTDGAASFSLGGGANSSSGAGFSADVGTKARLSDRLKFDID